MATCREATPPGVHKLGPWAGDDSELDVFAAKRYFNEEDALWCAGPSSSLSSAFRTGTTHEHDRSMATATAATSSSEYSWNSRSALLPEGKVLAADDAPCVEAESRGTGSERPRGKPPPLSHLRRWLRRCACICGDGEELASTDELRRDEVEEDNVVGGIGGKKFTNGAGELFEKTEGKELAAVEATYVRVRPGRWLDDDEVFLAGKAAISPIHVKLAKDGHRQAANSGEFSTPIMNPATTAALLHEQRRKSSEMLRPLGDSGSALVSEEQDSAAFTIVAGNTASGAGLHAAAAGGGGSAAPRRSSGISPCDTSEDNTAPCEVGCAYPPSEASVVWSVVTAEGAASCNFSSAASGYYYHLKGGEDGALRHDDGRSNRRRRRSGLTNGGGLLTCMGDKALNAAGPARRLGPQAGDRAGYDGYPDVMRRR